MFQNEGIELSYCSANLAVFSDSVGSVIYDRTKKKVIAAVDLDKIGCDHFYSEGDEEDPGLETAIKVSKDQKWMIIYNQLQGKVNGNIYAYSLKRCDNMKFAKITPFKQISEKDKLYQTIIKDHKHTQKNRTAYLERSEIRSVQWMSHQVSMHISGKIPKESENNRC